MTRIAGFVLSILLSATAVQQSLAQSAEEAAARERFQLSASMTQKAQLSRGEVNPNSLGMGSLNKPKPIIRDSIIATAPEPPRAAAQEDTPGSYLQEYNVDWRRWVSGLADKWFYILRGAEYTLGVQFSTPRAALIQFTCYADGTIGNVVLKQSSGVPAYDRLQLEALLATVPTTPFPAGTKRNSITLIQGWESHPKKEGEEDFQPGSFGQDFPAERVRQWLKGR